MRIIIVFGALLALAVIGATHQGSSNDDIENQPIKTQNKSEIIFNAIKNKGIAVEDVYTSNGSEIKKAFGLGNPNIEDKETIAFVIFRYSAQEGADIKAQSVLNVIYTTLLAEPSIDSVLVMVYDPSAVAVNGKADLIYTNRSYAQKVALEGLPLNNFYNRFEVYTIISEPNEDQ